MTLNTSTVWFAEIYQEAFESYDHIYVFNQLGTNLTMSDGDLSDGNGLVAINYTSSDGPEISLHTTTQYQLDLQVLIVTFTEMEPTFGGNECPGTTVLVSGNEGSINMGPYNMGSYTCKWQITGTLGSLTLVDLVIHHTDFGFDGITIYEGTEFSNVAISPNASLAVDGAFTSMTNEVYIEFVIGPNMAVGTGFTLTYKSALPIPFFSTANAGNLLWESQDWSAQASYTPPVAPISPAGDLRLANYINQGALWVKAAIPKLPADLRIVVKGINRKVLGGPGLGVYLVPGSIKSTPYLMDYSVDRSIFQGLGIFFQLSVSVVYAVSSDLPIALDDTPCGDTGSLPATCPDPDPDIGGHDQQFTLSIALQNTTVSVLYCIDLDNETLCSTTLALEPTNGLMQDVADSDPLYLGITALGRSGEYDYVDVRTVVVVAIEGTCLPSCSINGVCFASVCQCQSGWTDSTCSTPICSETCQNGGTCSGADTCTCVAGFLGRTCAHASCSGNTTISVDPNVTLSGYVVPDSYREEQYFDNQNCGWVISSTDPSYIITFHLATGTIDDNDQIKVFSNNEQILQTSGDFFKIYMATTSSVLYVNFITDGNGLRGSGFRLDYILELATFTSQVNGYVRNHEYESERYWANQDQAVLLMAPTGYSFYFDLETDSFFDPLVESVNIYDGPSTASPLIVSENGSSIQTFYTAMAGSLLVRFISGSILAPDQSDSGFELLFNWYKATPPCSSTITLTNDSGTIESDNYPTGNYKNNENCLWLIDVGTDQIWQVIKKTLFMVLLDFLGWNLKAILWNSMPIWLRSTMDQQPAIQSCLKLQQMATPLRPSQPLSKLSFPLSAMLPIEQEKDGS